MKLFRLSLAACLALIVTSACDCGSKKDPCDCVPSVEITQPGATVLTEFHDTQPAELGVQYPAAARTTCVPAGTILTFVNDRRPGETVHGTVALDDVESQTGHVEFADQTFEDGANHICVRGATTIDRMSDGTLICEPQLGNVEDCADVSVQLGVPACRFDDPQDGAWLVAGDDSLPAREGMQHDVAVSCKGVGDGTDVALLVNSSARVPAGQLANGQAAFDDVDLAEGVDLLRVETTDAQGGQVASEISVTIDTGRCAVRLTPANGTTFRAADDTDPNTDGLQVTLTAETDSAGTFSCADGSTVTLNVAGQDIASATLTNHAAAFVATFADGNIPVYAIVTGTSNGRSLTNDYLVCATALDVALSSPGDGVTITDAADRDPGTAGIQVAVTGTSSGVPDGAHLTLLVDGQVLMDGADPLQPVVFFTGGDFEFDYASFSLQQDYTLKVKGQNACGEEAESALNTVSVLTQQRTCLVTSPANTAVLLAADDKDSNQANDLQYDVQVNTANVADGATFTLFISGQSPVAGLSVQDNLSVNEVTFADGPKTLKCVLGTGESSPDVFITVDGHSPTIAISNPADGAVFDTTDATVDVTTTGVEDGQLATVTVAWTDAGGTPHQTDYSATVTGNVAGIDLVLGSITGAATSNTLTANVADQAGNPAQPDSITVSAQVFSDPPVLTFVDPDGSSGPVTIAEGDRLYTVIVQVQNVAAGAKVSLVVNDNGHDRAPITIGASGSGFATFIGVLLPRGDVTLSASATNAAGTGQATVTLVVGDTSLPLVIITDPADGAYTQQETFDVTVDSDVEQGQSCYICSRAPAGTLPADCDAGAAIGTGTADASGDAIISVTRPEGEYQLWASCVNLAAAVGTSVPNRVVIDHTAPTVQFTLPADAAVFNAASVDQSGQAGFQIKVQASADVEDGQAADLTVDGQPAELIGAAPKFAGNQITYNAVTLLDQAGHALGIQACDKAGNCTDATPVNVTVDRIAPDVMITSPIDLAQLGSSADQSAAVGFQLDVACALSGAAAGDTITLERKVGGGAFEQVATHQLTAAEAASGYTFDNATLITSDDTSADPLTIQIQATVTDAAANSDLDNVSISVNRVLPEVLITRPNPDQSFNLFADMSSDFGFQTQVNVETHYTQSGDLLVLCASPGTGYPVGHCTGHGNEVWVGTVTGVTTYLTGVNLDQGDNTLVAFSENLPGQGNYSAPITVHVDSLPPTVESVVISSDADGNGCIKQSEAVFQATVVVSGAEDGRNLCLLNGWPPGVSVGCATVTSGQAVFGMSLADGDYDLTARVTDAAGNPNINQASPAIADPEAQFAIAVDSVPPAVAISSPSKATLIYADDLNQSTQDLDFNFAATTDAEDGQLVSFLIDSNSAGTGVVAGGTAALQTSMGQSNHALSVSVRDACGNSTTSLPFNVLVDTVRPTITCSQPTDGSTFNDQQVPFVCQTTGTDATQQITVSSSVGGVACTPSVDGSGTTSFNCGLQEAANQTLTVTVRDPSGNVSDPYIINNVTVDVTGCTIAFRDYSDQVRFNASDDTVPGGNLQVDLVACSSGCSSSNCPACTVTLTVAGSQVGNPQAPDATGCTTFIGVTFVHQEMGTLVAAAIDDGAGNIGSNSFTVQMVDLVPPQLMRNAPGANDVQCVASTGNPNANGVDILADKVAGGDCQMDLGFTVTDGDFNQALYPVTLTVEESSAPIVTPVDLTASPQSQTFTNTTMAHDATHTLDVIATDYAGNATHLSMTVEADVIAPGQIIGATAALDGALAASRHADVDLGWTAVGDDGTTGTATAYAIRWARTPITNETQWAAAAEIPNAKNPAAPTTPETFMAQWLPPLNTYHIAIRSVDELGNHGPIPADLSVDNLWNEVTCTTPSGNFGYDMWNVGDLNGDNRDDLIVSAIFLDAGAGGNQGAVFVFYGDADLTNWSNIANAQQLNRNRAGEYFGFDVSSGDLDGDMIPDVAVTGFGFDGFRGRVSIYFGRSLAQLPGQPDVEIRATSATANQLGRSVEVIGDINGDGFDDLFIGAPVADGNGRGYIFFGRSRANWQAAATDIDPAPLDQSYIPLASADLNVLGCFSYRHGTTSLGDLDGDGKDDFALIASGVNELYTFDGAAASAITGRDIGTCADSVDIISQVVATPDSFRAGFGHRTAAGVDFTGDGLLDLLVTDAFSDRIYLLPGIDNSPSTPSVVIDGNYIRRINFTESINFGWDVDTGDINLDGWIDFITGSNSSAGHRAFVYLNTKISPFFDDSPAAVLSGAGGDYFGGGVAVGDFNGDGLPDIVSGAFGTNMIYILF